jgi:hypothetical protein
MKTEAHRCSTISSPYFRHVTRIETEKVAGACVTIKNDADQVPGIFSIILSVRNKDSFSRSMMFIAPDQDLLRFQINLCDGIKKGRLERCDA